MSSATSRTNILKRLSLIRTLKGIGILFPGKYARRQNKIMRGIFLLKWKEVLRQLRTRERRKRKGGGGGEEY